jgi:hypothetical protein
MNNDRKTKVTALVVFAVAAFIQTYPLALHPARGLNDTQDGLLNTWILAWGHQQILSHPLQFFQANVFYPNEKTLSYSESLLPLVILSLPVQLLFHNPVLSYNFVFLLCSLLNAYAMFLLVRHLTRRAAPGIIAGLVFAYSAVFIQQISHLQLWAAWFIPLAFLFLHKFFEEGRRRDSILFALCLVLQALACVYYGLFFIAILVVALPSLLILRLDKITWRFLRRLFLPLLAAGAALVLFSLPYLWLFAHFQFKRTLARGAEIQNYLAVPPTNILLGWLLHRLGSYEFFLFPGIAAFALAAYFAVKTLGHVPLLPKMARLVLAIIVGLCAASLLFILVTGGTGARLGPVTLSISNPARPAFILFLTLTLWYLAGTVMFFLKRRRLAEEPEIWSRLYSLVVLWAVYLSFGRGFGFSGSSPFNQRFHGDWVSPFHWFYDLVPGFKGIRVPSRCAVFVIFGVAVLAGLGWNTLTALLRTKKVRTAALVLAAVFINVEYLCIPQKWERVPVGRDIPATYDWLKEQPGQSAIVELPFFAQIPNESAYMYLSLFHGKSTLNGYSGFIPYSSDYIRAVFADFPSWGAIDILQKLNVKYVVLHAKAWKEQRTASALRRIRKRYRTALKLVKTFRYDIPTAHCMAAFLGDDYIFEVMPPVVKPAAIRTSVELSPERWTVHAGREEALVPLLKDGRLDTSWTTHRAKLKADYLNIVLDETLPVKRVELLMGDHPYDWAVNIQVNISQNGRKWRPGYPGYSPGEFVRQLVSKPRDAVQTIYLSGRPVRYLKIIQKGKGSEYFWSVAEIRIYVAKD